jgi:hypothetical protein
MIGIAVVDIMLDEGTNDTVATVATTRDDTNNNTPIVV